MNAIGLPIYIAAHWPCMGWPANGPKYFFLSGILADLFGGLVLP